MAKGIKQHILNHPEGWAVKGEANSKATKVSRTQAQAIINGGEYRQKPEVEFQISWRGRKDPGWQQLRLRPVPSQE